jgi:hypothetical protein
VPPNAPGSIILEVTTIGSSQKVTAVDEATGTEVSFIAPTTASQLDIERLARAKLAYVMQKKGDEV